MKRSRFSDEQIIAILKEQEAGMPTAEVCRRHGISPATFYKWKAKYGGLEVSEAKRLRSMEDENAKLKKLLAEAMLDIPVLSFAEGAVLKDITAKKHVLSLSKGGDARRKAGSGCAWPGGVGLSERRACGIIGVSRRVNSYASRRPDDAALRVRLRDLASERRRLGYRRLGCLLAREGITPNHKKLLRI